MGDTLAYQRSLPQFTRLHFLVSVGWYKRHGHVAIRTFKVTLDSDLNAGEYAFFMGTGQQAMMTEGRVSAGSGGTVAGRIYDFNVPD